MLYILIAHQKILSCMCSHKTEILFLHQHGGENMRKSEMPVGFAMALAMNPDAMQKFAAMNEVQKHEIIAEVHTIHSKEEMQRYVDSLTNGER